MKISKLFLLPTTAVAIATPMFFSCGKEGWTVEDLEDALFHPCVEDPDTTLADGIGKMIEDKDDAGLQKEVIFALYANCIYASLHTDWPTIDELYNGGFLSLVANIHKCSLEFREKQYRISFLGYINFVFVKPYSDKTIFDQGDFIQITYSIDDYQFTIENKALRGLELSPPVCWGFIQSNKWPLIKYINYVSGYVPEKANQAHNWHNWNK